MAKENKAKKKDEWGEQNAPFSVIVLHLLVLPVWQVLRASLFPIHNRRSVSDSAKDS
jgi:hypothetical protein